MTARKKPKVPRQKPPLAEKVKKLREAKGMTQQDLAQASGLSMSVISQIEQGKRSDVRVSTIIGIAAALGVPFAELIQG